MATEHVEGTHGDASLTLEQLADDIRLLAGRLNALEETVQSLELEVRQLYEEAPDEAD